MRKPDQNIAATLSSVVVLSIAIASSVYAGFVPGGGSSAADCYAGLDVTGVTSSSGRIECTEGDPCDTGPCGDGKCTFELQVCANRLGVSGCTPPVGGLQSLKAPGPLKSGVPASLAIASCGNTLTLDLKLKKNGSKANKRVLRTKATAVSGTNPRKDQDSFLFMCKPRAQACSPSGAFVD